MKIIAISSSPKGKASNTLKLLELAAVGTREAGADVEIVDVAKLKINFCKGDSSCYRTGACFQDDDYATLKEKIVAADGIILSAPNYIDNIPAQLKVVLDMMDNFIAKSGGLRTGRLGMAMAHGPDAAVTAEKKAQKMGKDLVKAIKEKRAYPEQVAEHKKWKDQFASTVKFNKENWKHNYDLWVSMGWIKV